jgi:sporulation protein YlmC with PRC-barrel domain
MANLPISKLRGWDLADPGEDLRGLSLMNEAGETLGTVADLVVNTETELVEKVMLNTGENYPLRRLRRDGRLLRLIA